MRLTGGMGKGSLFLLHPEAPEEVGIFREEIFEQVASANVEAASQGNALVGPIRAVRGHAKNRMGGSHNG